MKNNKKIKLPQLETPVMNAGAGTPGGPLPAIIAAIIIVARISV
jgi:hypothetical protein